MNDEQAELDSLRRLDPQMLSAIHQRYFPEVYRYARYRLGDDIQAEDLASDVFVRLIEAINAGRGPTSTVRGWLMGTISNLVNEQHRRNYAHPDNELHDGLTADESDPARLAEGQERAHLVRAALTQLTNEQQHVLALRFGSGHSLEETAMLMGKNANAIKALQFRALASLKRLIEGKL